MKPQVLEKCSLFRKTRCRYHGIQAVKKMSYVCELEQKGQGGSCYKCPGQGCELEELGKTVLFSTPTTNRRSIAENQGRAVKKCS